MRTIRFRGKRIANGNWIYGDLFREIAFTPTRRKKKSEYSGFWAIQTETPDGIKSYSVDPETVGQFTDIKDGKGTEIYKDDIIEVTLRHNKETVSTYIAVVDQKEGAFGFKNKQGFCPFYGQIHENYRVIGNIHDNPELMKGGAQ